MNTSLVQRILSFSTQTLNFTKPYLHNYVKLKLPENCRCVFYSQGTWNAAVNSGSPLKVSKENSLYISNNVESAKQRVIEEFKKNRDKHVLDNHIEIKMYLIKDLGFAPLMVADLGKDCPEIYQCSLEEVDRWVSLLLHHSFTRKDIEKLIKGFPWIFLIDIEKTIKVLHLIQENMEISRLELPRLCVGAPCVLFDDFEVTVDKHNYFFYTIGYKNLGEVFKSNVFAFSLEHIEQRHLFLSRRGQYFQYYRDGTVKRPNPSVTKAFCSSDEFFCEKVAKCDLNEYKLFQKVFLVEKMQQETALPKGKIMDVYGKKKFVEDDDLNDEDDDVDDKSNSFANELLKNL